MSTSAQSCRHIPDFITSETNCGEAVHIWHWHAYSLHQKYYQVKLQNVQGKMEIHQNV